MSTVIIKTKSNLMKKSFLIIVIVGFLAIGLTEIQAQTTQPKLNQVELFKQIIGNWKVDMAKDTVLYWDAKEFGTGLECTDKTYAKDKLISEEKELYGYDSKLDKYVGVDLVKGGDIEVWVLWFTSNTKFEAVHLSDISNPDKATVKAEGEVKSPDAYLNNFIMNGKVILTYNFKRVK